MFDLIPITAQFSNAVLVAVLPYIGQFAQKIELPVTVPITLSQVHTFEVSNRRDNMGGCVTLTNGYMFWFEHGNVQAFRATHCYFALQDPQQIPSFYGPLKLNEAEAIALARSYIRKLGYTEESLYADLEPKVTIPSSVQGHTIPHYRIEWEPPNREKFTDVEIEIDAAKKEAASIYFANLNLWRDNPPSLTTLLSRMPPIKQPTLLVGTNEILSKITGFARKLNLPIDLPVVADHISAIRVIGTGLDDTCQVCLTNQFRFVYASSEVCGFTSPDVFFTWQHEIKVKEYFATKHLSEKQSISLVRAAVNDLGYPPGTFVFDQKPEVQYPNGTFRDRIPRLMITLKDKDNKGIAFAIRAEVDAGSGAIKSLHFDLRKEVHPLY